MKGERYRSVEHYAYQRLFDALRLDDKCIEKIKTTIHPCDVATVAGRVFKQQEVSDVLLESKIGRLDRWRQSAMKHKMTKNDFLQQLLLATGHAILVDTTDGDEQWTSGIDEFELQHLLSKQYINPLNLLEWMTERVKAPAVLQHIKGNKTGLLLMELRSKFATSLSTSSRISLISPLLSANALRTLVSAHMICFTMESVFHFLYPANIRPSIGSDKILPSPAHFVATQAIKYFNFCKDDADWIMESEQSLECWHRLYLAIEKSNASLEIVQGWFMEERQKSIKAGLALMFEQHPPLMRTLLDTGDALLVYCSRFSTLEAELTVGMRERDLRAWLLLTDLDTKQFFDLTLCPMALRPSYLGGNRLGYILMELRREFVLRGVFPQQYPELPISAESILGSESAAESYVASHPFSNLDEANFRTTWANPFLLYAKEKKENDLWILANSQKAPPKLMSVDEEKITALLEEIDEEENPSEEVLLNYSSEDIRSLFMKLSLRLQNELAEYESQNADINYLAKEITSMQSSKRALETRKHPPETQRPERREKRDLPPHSLSQRPTPAPLRSFTPPRKWDESPSRKWEDRRKFLMRRHSPDIRSERTERPQRRRSPFHPKLMPVSPPSVKESSPQKDNSPPPSKQAKPAKPPVDESELSEGEIVSD
ncbi:hypothetical protein AB6A40_006919 [Gnathostoma spinigerum]|uniref:NADAR domain-containing protein n=1 Tax=Gnathostoma spinigerum TaxID=75299 RepID=A0ABD6EJR6_9BILA